MCGVVASGAEATGWCVVVKRVVSVVVQGTLKWSVSYLQVTAGHTVTEAPASGIFFNLKYMC